MSSAHICFVLTNRSHGMAFLVDTRCEEFLRRYRCIWFREKVCGNMAVEDDGYNVKKRNLMYCASELELESWVYLVSQFIVFMKCIQGMCPITPSRH